LPLLHVGVHDAVHLPSVPGMLHASHAPEHALLQQTPSTQKPEAQLALLVQYPPLPACAITHAPKPLQFVAHSSSGSVLTAIFPHVPSLPLPFFTAEHAWQAPVHALSQQTPSTHEPDVHSPALAQTVPLGALTHAPAPLHVRPHSSSGSVLFAMTPH
jgi:hypothetical protein